MTVEQATREMRAAERELARHPLEHFLERQLDDVDRRISEPQERRAQLKIELARLERDRRA